MLSLYYETEMTARVLPSAASISSSLRDKGGEYRLVSIQSRGPGNGYDADPFQSEVLWRYKLPQPNAIQNFSSWVTSGLKNA